MAENKIFTNPTSLPKYPANLAVLINKNTQKFQNNPIYQENHNGSYVPLSWTDFYTHILAIQAWLKSLDFGAGDRLAILSGNCREMLELELAVMTMGAIVVPIFPGYSSSQTGRLLTFCNASIVAVADQNQYNKIISPAFFKSIVLFNPPLKEKGKNVVHFDKLITYPKNRTEIIGLDLSPDTITLMMYTSGTMGKPKCVQLTHKNILSQQAAMKALWNLNKHDRFLSYLPWHHSFGGIFEKFAAIVNGAVISLEHGFGKDIELLLENWDKVRPTVFFSVPRIFQAIANRIFQNPEVEKIIFHPKLRFVFTAAAPLPKNVSDLFQNHQIPVVEGWGLTETSPCCTITDTTISRELGVVGKPIPGVSLQLAEDGEILVKGPNVMTGYYNNREATAKVLSSDGWFYTGDVGKYTPDGLRLISRKDRIFKLSNAEKVIPSEIEALISKDCAYLAHALMVGSGKDFPVILLFPNKEMFSQRSVQPQLLENCKCPQELADFSTCLTTCLKNWNRSIDAKFSRIKKAMLIDYELSIENEELTPSMKLAPNVVGKVFKANIESLYNDDVSISEKVYIINLV